MGGTGVRVRPLECGWLTSDLGAMVSGRSGRFHMPVAAFLVEHPNGTAVFDTGMHSELLVRTDRMRRTAELFEVHHEQRFLLAAQLALNDVDPAAVDIAVLSHLHFDHCGGLAQLPEARVVVQRAEWEAAFHPGLVEYGAYNPPDFDLGHDQQLLEGELDLFGDGSVRVVPTPGHTAGHQSLLIEDRLLLVGDACYCRLALDTDGLPPYSDDPEKQRAGFAWLRGQEAEGKHLVFSHDPEQWAGLGPEL